MAKNRPMYNEDLKRAFIDDTIQSDSSRIVAENAFRAIFPYEKAWGADYCTRTVEEITPVLEKISGLKARSRYTRLNLFSDYSKWCVKNGVPGAIDNTVSRADLGPGKLDQTTIRNPEHLQHSLDMIFEPESEETVDNTYRCFFWLAYGGMMIEDAVELTSKDIDFESMTAEHGESSAVLYRQGLPAIHNCIRLTQFRYKHPNYKPVWKNRINGEEILRGTKGGKVSDTSIRSLISRRIGRDATDSTILLSYQRVWRCGVYYRLYEKEQAGVSPNFYFASMSSPTGRKLLSKEQNSNTRRRIIQMASDFKRDYMDWKRIVQI